MDISYIVPFNIYLNNFRIAIVLIHNIGKLCKEAGIEFVFHNHADELLCIDNTRVYDYFIKHTNPEYVHFQAELYWIHIAGVNPSE
ncbi:hypothetical protein [Cellulophaga tyrosinoxydans]|uniref:hypothetical protein n=1 Tax=Cellulophaga tyrosinoxydans TaxID=504486 RepID=UPI000A05C4CE|nr:hypothetical protein [Cellulophaga tyrosinoxydans]